MPTSSVGDRGFTLVEIIVVVVIVSVLTAMAVPRLSGRSGPAELRAAARDLLCVARYARDFAATRRCECRLEIDPAQGRYLVTAEIDPNSPGEFYRLRSLAVRPRKLPPSVRFGRVRVSGTATELAEADHIAFRPDGRCDAALVEITDGRRVYTLSVAADTGRVGLVENAVAEPPNERVDLDAQKS
jgi:prepilin-type N-terminal cleavage/methylation domain-containing protein